MTKAESENTRRVPLAQLLDGAEPERLDEERHRLVEDLIRDRLSYRCTEMVDGGAEFSSLPESYWRFGRINWRWSTLTISYPRTHKPGHESDPPHDPDWRAKGIPPYLPPETGRSFRVEVLIEDVQAVAQAPEPKVPHAGAREWRTVVEPEYRARRGLDDTTPRTELAKQLEKWVWKTHEKLPRKPKWRTIRNEAANVWDKKPKK
jgi:hypothetical protein